jgi:hypothetical protein
MVSTPLTVSSHPRRHHLRITIGRNNTSLASK